MNKEAESSNQAKRSVTKKREGSDDLSEISNNNGSKYSEEIDLAPLSGSYVEKRKCANRKYSKASYLRKKKATEDLKHDVIILKEQNINLKQEQMMLISQIEYLREKITYFPGTHIPPYR
mmetsp:Transcript_34802/g.68492  ORF Transcript_34802/g.68492 Transcript_34802/m.68492 type:complete len:120 (+) Transcript_34802:158-517(+)